MLTPAHHHNLPSRAPAAEQVRDFQGHPTCCFCQQALSERRPECAGVPNMLGEVGRSCVSQALWSAPFFKGQESSVASIVSAGPGLGCDGRGACRTEKKARADITTALLTSLHAGGTVSWPGSPTSRKQEPGLLKYLLLKVAGVVNATEPSLGKVYRQNLLVVRHGLTDSQHYRFLWSHPHFTDGKA